MQRDAIDVAFAGELVRPPATLFLLAAETKRLALRTTATRLNFGNGAPAFCASPLGKPAGAERAVEAETLRSSGLK